MQSDANSKCSEELREDMAHAREQVNVRQSITFTQTQHDALLELANSNQVSFCWIVRHACDLLLSESSKRKKLIELSTDEGHNEHPNGS